MGFNGTARVPRCPGGEADHSRLVSSIVFSSARCGSLLADTYRTTRIMTLDQRHFRVLRPLWGADYFTILPYEG